MPVLFKSSSFALRPGRRGSLALVLMLSASSLAAAGCQANAGGVDKKKDGKEEVAEVPTPVVVGAVERGAIVATISAASTIEAERQVTIHAESTGRLVDLTVEEGDTVKKGQILARIRFDAQTNSLLRANTSLEKARVDFERAEKLFNDKVIGQEEFLRAQNALEIAQLDLSDRSREMRNTKVTAPFDGTITQRKVTAGAFVNNGAELLTIVDFRTLVARVFVPEKQLDRIQVGQEAEVVGKAARGRKGAGKILRIAPTIDASTGTVKVTVSMPPALAGPQAFLPGMYAEVTLRTDSRSDVPLVPKSAVVRDEEQTYLFTVTGDPTTGFIAKRVRVETGLTDPERIEIVKGLAAGEPVITAGQTGLKDGAKVVRVDPQGKPLDPPIIAPISPALEVPAEANADKQE
ncbi:MAG TPA: efflux RND transporter periplasmic adaptor subunit [Nannocystis sp.]|jgi:membrane fusion protein (multidrug efflux system)